MMEKWLPASLRNSENPFYENLLVEADGIIEEFLDSKVRTIKNIYSISNSSLDDLMDIAESIYLLDRNILKGAYKFLQSQYSSDIEGMPQTVTELVAVFCQLNFIPFRRQVTEPGGYTYWQEGVYIEAPLDTDFENSNEVQFFTDMIESYVPGVNISIEDHEFYFIYPIGADEDMKVNLLQSIKNAVCDYAVKYRNGFGTMLAKDPVAEGWVTSISGGPTVFSIVADMPALWFDSLGQVVCFHVEYSSYSVNAETYTLTIDCSDVDKIALEKFRDEISKVPVSIAQRGMYSFYTSLFNTFGFNFPGVLSLMKTESNILNAKLLDNIELNKHAVAGSETAIVSVPVKETFTAQENITNTLDDNIGTELDPQYKTLDEIGLFNKLDMVSMSEDTVYKKNLLLGFQINQKNFNGLSIFPQEFSKFLQELLMLNQKATDVVNITPIISIDIDKDDMDSSKILTDTSGFMKVMSSSYQYNDIHEFDGFRLKMQAYEYDGSSYVKFYDYYLDENTDFIWNPSFDASIGEKCLTTKTLVEGKKLRLSNLPCDVVSSRKLTCDVPEGFVTKNIVLKLFAKSDEYTNYMMFREDRYGLFSQTFGPMDDNGEFTYNVSVSIDGNEIIFESSDDFVSVTDEYQMTIVSEKTETKLAKLTLFGEYMSGDDILTRPLWSIEFKDKDENPLYMDLPSNVNMMAIVSRHEWETT